jgi:thiol:disulfide interchange protein DsbC
MRKYIPTTFVLILLILSFMAYPVFAAGTASKKQGCEKISQTEIQDILKSIKAEKAKVIYVKDSPLTGICELALDAGRGPAILYFDVAKTHLIFGNLVDLKTMANLSEKSVMEIRDKKKIDISKIPLGSALVLGDAKADKKVIIFTDPDCPYCGNLHKTMKQIVEKRKDIAFYIKLFPMEFHKDAYWKSVSIICANSMQLLEDCFDKKEITKTECKTEEVNDTLKLGRSFGIDGTPAIILPDGKLRMGSMPEDELLKLIDDKK